MLTTDSQSIREWLRACSAAVETVDFTKVRSVFGNADANGAFGCILSLASAELGQTDFELHVALSLSRVFVEALSTACSSFGLSSGQPSDALRRIEYCSQHGELFCKPHFSWLPLLQRFPCFAEWSLLHAFSDLAWLWASAASIPSDYHKSSWVGAWAVRQYVHSELQMEAGRILRLPQTGSSLEVFSAGADSWKLLAAEATAAADYHLPEGIPQSAVYSEPRIQVFEPQGKTRIEWDTLPVHVGSAAVEELILTGQTPFIVVIAEARGGKSALLRTIAARCAVAQSFPVCFRWSDLKTDSQLTEATSIALASRYRLSFEDLRKRTKLIFFFDGVDESTDQSETAVLRTLSRLAEFSSSRCSSVIASVRGELVTEFVARGLVRAGALVVRILRPTSAEISTYRARCSNLLLPGLIDNPSSSIGAEHVSIAPGPARCLWISDSVTAKHHHLRQFINEAVASAVGVQAPALVPLVRRLMQDIAYYASQPEDFPRARVEILRQIATHSETLAPEHLPALIRLSPVHADRLEFESAIFRQYLLAERCIRERVEASSQSSTDITKTLGLCTLRELEREFVNDLYEELGRSAGAGAATLSSFLNDLGVRTISGASPPDISALYEEVRAQAEWPTFPAIPEFPSSEAADMIPPAFKGLSILVNLWDHALLATFGLYRGLGLDPYVIPIFKAHYEGLATYLKIRDAVRGHNWSSEMNLSRLGLSAIRLPRACFYRDNLSYSNLQKSDLTGAVLNSANLQGADLTDADASRVDFTHANLSCTTFSYARTYKTVFLDATLDGCSFTGVDLSRARMLRDALSPEQLATCKCPPQ